MLCFGKLESGIQQCFVGNNATRLAKPGHKRIVSTEVKLCKTRFLIADYSTHTYVLTLTPIRLVLPVLIPVYCI